MNGASPNQVNPRAGYRNRRFGRGSEFHLLAQRPGGKPNAARRVSFAMGRPEEVGRDVSGGEVYTTSVSLGLLSNSSVRNSAAIIDSGASANLVGANWLNNHGAIPRVWGDL